MFGYLVIHSLVILIIKHVADILVGENVEKGITVQKSRNNSREFTERMIRFLEVLGDNR